MKPNLKFRAAFTLIELLIVVAIIAILVAIAVPNLLLAQTRAKVSREQADQRTVAIAMEAYASDTSNRYPEYGHPQDSAAPSILFLPVRLTTPVAYVTSLPSDVFIGQVTAAPQQHTFYYRHNYDANYLGSFRPGGHVQEHYHSLTGSDAPVMWEEWSFGPDLDDDHGVTLYDATNGTISNGDLMRFGP